ncbi:MAG: hypothetical protein ACETWD_07915, partial [Desulfatiglandales bacterium]
LRRVSYVQALERVRYLRITPNERCGEHGALDVRALVDDGIAHDAVLDHRLVGNRHVGANDRVDHRRRLGDVDRRNDNRVVRRHDLIVPVVKEVTVLTGGGIVERRGRLSLAFRYRGLDLNSGEIILNATLNLRLDKPGSIRKRVISNIKWRKERFPLDMPCAGSIFKNPESDYAGRLIDAVGLKGRTIGGAMISPKHANFIVNTGRASVSDILALMDLAMVNVREIFNIQLIPEIKVVGKG